MSGALVLFPLRSGEVPRYDRFVRHVWRFVEHGDSALCPPPDMFTLPLDDDGDVAIVGQEATRCLRDFEFGADRIVAVREQGQIRVTFRDLEVLHTFLRLLAQRSNAGDAQAREVLIFTLRMLGFEWSGVG